MDPLIKNNVKVTGNTASTRTLVFGHGFGTDQTSWRSVTEAFQDHYRIIVFDNVGSGIATYPGYSQARYAHLQSYADDIVDLCDALQIRNSTYIGHSVGAMMGMLASLKAPEIFTTHVFMNASPRYLNDTNYRGGFEQSDLDALYRSMADNYQAWVSGFAPAVMANPDRPQLATEIARSLAALRPDIALPVLKAIFQSDFRTSLSAFNKYSLIIQSNHDIAVPMEVGQYLSQNINNSVYTVINATGHFPHISAPEEVVRAIKSFLR